MFILRLLSGKHSSLSSLPSTIYPFRYLLKDFPYQFLEKFSRKYDTRMFLPFRVKVFRFDSIILNAASNLIASNLLRNEGR